MSTEVITVPFVRGKGRVRFVRATGRTYTPDKTAEAMALIRAEWGDRPAAPKGTPVAVTIVTTRPLPASRPKRVAWEADTAKPDADNIAKLVLDALNGVAWADDTQVTDLTVQKMGRTRHMPEQTTVSVTWEDEHEQG